MEMPAHRSDRRACLCPAGSPGQRPPAPRMNLNANKSRLMGLTKEIALRWEDTKHHWRDAKSAEFDRRYMAELFPRVNQAVTAIEKLEELYKQIRKECE